MKNTARVLIVSLFTAGTLFSTQTLADGPHDGPDRQWHQHDDRGDGDHRSHGERAERDHFAWQGHNFRRGHPLPPRFRGDDYRIDDWRERGLYEPPRGSEWVYVDGNYVLVAVATGVITSILLGNALSH